jgi:predicted HNH restriction endonuclease
VGIYTILSESDEKARDGHKKYNVKCNVCGYESCMQMSTIKRARFCRHAKEYPQLYCQTCGKPLEKTGSYAEYMRKNFCSQSCAASSSNKIRNKSKITQNKYCLNCGKILKPTAQKFCDNECLHNYRYEQYIHNWKNGQTDGLIGINWIDVSSYIKRYLFEKYDSKCAICGWSEMNVYSNTIPLEIEHIDGNAFNNAEENLLLLCPNCHSLTKTYRGLNKGNGQRGIKWIARSGNTNIK